MLYSVSNPADENESLRLHSHRARTPSIYSFRLSMISPIKKRIGDFARSAGYRAIRFSMPDEKYIIQTETIFSGCFRIGFERFYLENVVALLKVEIPQLRMHPE